MMINNVKQITSHENKYFQLFKSLNDSKGLKKEKSFLVSGNKLVHEFVKKHPTAIKAVISSEQHLLSEQILDFLNSSSNASSIIYNYQFSQKLFHEIDSLGTHSPLLWVDQKEIPIWDPTLPPQGLEVICPLGDPQNLGAVARSAWAFGASKIILLQESANPFLPRSWKASSGAIWELPLYKGPSLKDLNTPCVALDMNGENIWNFAWPKNVRLLLGEEGQGLPESIKRQSTTLKLPMVNAIESLNVSVSASIAIGLYSHQHFQLELSL